MMPSMKKKVSSFFKQLSASGHPDCEQSDCNPGTSRSFIQRYLCGNETKRQEPTILYGRSPQELPPLAIRDIDTSQESIFASMTGPDEGLTSVIPPKQRHLSTSDPDVDYIDSNDDAFFGAKRKPKSRADSPLRQMLRQMIHRPPDPLPTQQLHPRKAHADRRGDGEQSLRESFLYFLVSSTNCVFSSVSGRWFNVPQSLSVKYPIDNSDINIRAGGKLFAVGKRSVYTSVSDLTSSDMDVESDDQANAVKRMTEENSEPESGFETYSSHDNLHNDRLAATAELINAIDRTLIRFGLNDNSAYQSDPNMNEEVRPFADNRNERFASDLEKNLINKAHEFRAGESRKRRRRGAEPPDTQEGCDSGEETAAERADYLSLSKSTNTGSFALRKSKSAPNPFKNARLRFNLEGNATSKFPRNPNDIAGISNWNRPHNRAYGLVTTLYEVNPITQEHAGNPIADCFAIVARENSVLMALADGVNWGEKSCLAARAAIHGSIDYLNKTLFSPDAKTKVTNTTDVFVALLRSFHMAHSLILQKEAMLTTLTVAVVLPLEAAPNYIVCVCNVGDSLAYVYSLKNGVREITKGSHDINCMRDMRDALGALGPVDGTNPELSNLTCSMTEAEAGDIVFITSDGISDNFDPVVGKFAVLSCNKPDIIGQNLPIVQAFQRHELTLLRLEDLLTNDVSGNGPVCTLAKDLCDRLLDFVVRLTAAKRKILEDMELYYKEENGVSVELTKAEQRSRRKNACERLLLVPGKLDHASVVAYNVGRYRSDAAETGITISKAETAESRRNLAQSPRLSSFSRAEAPAGTPEDANHFQTTF